MRVERLPALQADRVEKISPELIPLTHLRAEPRAVLARAAVAQNLREHALLESAATVDCAIAGHDTDWRSRLELVIGGQKAPAEDPSQPEHGQPFARRLP